MATAKATAFRGYRNYLRAALAQPDYDAFIASFSPDLKAIFLEAKIMVSRSYPIELQHEFLEHCRNLWPRDHAEHLVKMGRTVAETDLTGIYKVIIKISSVEMTLRVLVSAWRNYFSDGRAELVHEEKKRYTFDITDLTQHPLHRYIVEGYAAAAVELAGGKGAAVTSETTERAEVMRFLVTWKD